jgi:ATP-binding protein involved in chromosome partitioning
VERYGLQIASAGFILGEDQPMGITQVTLNLLARQMISDVSWPALSYVVVDLPPGTSAVQHSLIHLLRPDLAIVVVTPQLTAHVDGRKAVQMFRLLGVPVHGAIENMAGVSCPHCGERFPIYPQVPDARSVWSLGVERLETLEIDLKAAFRPDGIPFFEGEGPAHDARFRQLADSVAERLPHHPEPPQPTG